MVLGGQDSSTSDAEWVFFLRETKAAFPLVMMEIAGAGRFKIGL